MPDYTIIEAKAFHCGAMCRKLRAGHKQAIALIGMDSHRELRALFDASSFRRSAVMDGNLVAMWGVAGQKLSTFGFVWLLCAESLLKHPLTLIKGARQQLDEIMLVKRELTTTVLGTDEAAIRFAVFLGFHVSHDAQGQPAVTREGRKNLAKFVKENPEFRVPFGDGYAVVMGYHPEHEEAA